MSSFVTGTVVPTPTLPFLSTAAALLPALSRTSSTGFAPVAEVERITSVPPASPEPPTPKAPETVVEPGTFVKRNFVAVRPPKTRPSNTYILIGVCMSRIRNSVIVLAYRSVFLITESRPSGPCQRPTCG